MCHLIILKESLCLFSSFLVELLILQCIGEAPIPHCKQTRLSFEGKIMFEQYFDVG